MQIAISGACNCKKNPANITTIGYRAIRYSFIHHLLRQLAATYTYTVKYSCTINYIYIQ